MRTVGVVLLAALLVVAAQLPFGRALQSTSPAFLWSPYLDGMKENVDYRVVSPRQLAKSVMTEGRWSNYMCSGEEGSQSQNFAFLFVGKELRSLDVSSPENADPALMDFLKDSFSNSNFSLAFPYVAAPEEQVAIENSLLSEFTDSCQHKLGISNIAVMGSCFLEDNNVDRLKDIDSVHDYLNSRMEKNSGEQTNLVVLCQEDSPPLHHFNPPYSESSILSKLVSFTKQLGVKYTFLYVSDPSRSTQHPSFHGLDRFLAEGNLGNESVTSDGCDGVCRIKSSLLEGILVVVVLLVILISGLCCMMGIDTPTRFETPQDS